MWRCTILANLGLWHCARLHFFGEGEGIVLKGPFDLFVISSYEVSPDDGVGEDDVGSQKLRHFFNWKDWC